MTTNQTLTTEARQARQEFVQIWSALIKARTLAVRLADDYGLEHQEEGLVALIDAAIGQTETDCDYLVEMVQAMTEEVVTPTVDVGAAFNQWATYWSAKVKSQITNDPDGKIIFSWCCDCGKGLGAVNGNRIGHCADAGEPCQVPAVPRVGQP